MEYSWIFLIYIPIMICGIQIIIKVLPHLFKIFLKNAKGEEL